MELLSGHAGSWLGTNRFRLMPDDHPAEATATAQLSMGARGNVAVIAYTWAHPADGEQEGLLVLGPGQEPDAVVALWGDSWHQKPAVTQLQGTIADGAITVSYAYAEGWEWRITITPDGPDGLHLRMDNVVPPSAAAGAGAALTYWAMDAELHRS